MQPLADMQEEEKKSPSKGRYLRNVIWTWAGSATNILVAALVSPIVVRKLGNTTFSIWSLALSIVEYFWLIDIGLRSATVKFSAEYVATKQTSRLNQLISTAVVYSTFAAALMLPAAYLLTPYLAKVLDVRDPAFPKLIMIVAVSWACGMIFTAFGAVLEGIQKFEVFSHIWIVMLASRSVCILVALRLGYGLMAMGYILLLSQFGLYFATFLAYRRIMPETKVSWGSASLSMFRTMMNYGFHSMVVNVSTRFSTQSVPVLITYFLKVDVLAFYQIPQRMLDYAMEGIGRVGMVTTPNAAEKLATGRGEELKRLGIFANRYSLVLFMPVTVFLSVYGFELMSLWILPDFARRSAYLLPAFLVSTTVLAGQFNSVSLLFGIARHKLYSRFLVVESLLLLLGMSIVLPRFGLLGAAWLAGVLVILNRGIGACILTARELAIAPLRYAWEIYSRPVAVGGVTLAVLFALKQWILPGTSWVQLITAGVIMSVVYLPLTLWVSVAKDDRMTLQHRLLGILGR